MKINSLLIAGMTVILSACGSDPSSTGIEFAPQMYHSIPLEAYSQQDYNRYFADGKNAQAPVTGTIAQGKMDNVYPFPNTPEGYEQAGKELKSPISGTTEVLAEAKTLFENNCSHCHGNEGKNDGAVMKSGKSPKPGWPSYDSEYIQKMPEGKIYHSITYGRNLMGSHASQLPPAQRWKVVEYVKHLSNPAGTAVVDEKTTTDSTKKDTKVETKKVDKKK